MLGTLFCFFIIEIIDGLENNKICSRTRPNQGLWNTAKNFAIICLLNFPAVTLAILFFKFSTGQSLEYKSLLLYSLLGSTYLGMGTFQAIVKHGVLRLLLWVNRSIPWNYADFLDHSRQLRLVQSVGGRYRFVHDLLREEMIGATPPARRLAMTPDWIQYSGGFFGLLLAILAGQGTQLVSSKLAQLTMPILRTGDLVFFDRYSYRFTDPQQYDLVSFRAEDAEEISREWIVGLPGETISSKDSQLLVNGKLIDRPYTHFPPNFRIKKPFQIPDQSYFVVGKAIDKNGKSVPTGEVIHRKQLIDKCSWRLWPLQRFGAIK